MLVKIGLCQGTSSKTRGNFEEHYVLVSNEEPDEFGRTVEVTTGIRLSKKQLDSGIRDLYDNLKGKQVCIPVYNRPWKSAAGNVGMDTWLSQDGKPIPLVSQGQLKAAS